MSADVNPAPTPVPEMPAPFVTPTPTAATPPGSNQTQGPAVPEPREISGAAPVSRVRPGFGSLRLDLTDAEFQNPITAKFLYREVERLDAELAIAQPYVKACADAEQNSAVLTERLSGQDDTDRERRKNQTLADVGFGTGVGIGCMMIGVSPTFAALADPTPQRALIAIGVLLVFGGIAIKVLKR